MKILIIEDHLLVREMLEIACAQVVKGAAISGAADGTAARAICAELLPELVILDVGLPDIDGLDLLQDLRAVVPQARFIVLSSHVDEYTVHRALSAEVHGFVDKKEAPLATLREAIATVQAGRKFFSSSVRLSGVAQRRDSAAFTKILSDWEQTLLALLGQGLSNEEIAQRVSRSPVTVKNHRCRIMAKVGVHTSAELIRYAIERGFTRAPGSAVTQPSGRRK